MSRKSPPLLAPDGPRASFAAYPPGIGRLTDYVTAATSQFQRIAVIAKPAAADQLRQTLRILQRVLMQRRLTLVPDQRSAALLDLGTGMPIGERPVCSSRALNAAQD